MDIELEGIALLTDPLLNKGSAFTEDERDAISTCMASCRRMSARSRSRSSADSRRLREFETDLERYRLPARLAGYQRDAVLRAVDPQPRRAAAAGLYADRRRRLPGVQPQFLITPRGLFLSWPHREIASTRSSPTRARPRRGHRGERRRAHPRPRRSGRRRHGHPDRQARALHAPAPASHPATTLPILLDVGTDNRGAPGRSALHRLAAAARARRRTTTLSSRPSCSAVKARWPHVLLQWEDFARGNAGRLLERYRDRSAPSTTTSRARPRSLPARCSRRCR